MRVYLVTLFVFSFYLCAFSALADPPEQLGIIWCDTSHTEFGFRITPAGDQNGDGYDDLLIWDYRSAYFLYYGGDSVAQLPALRFDSANSRADNLGDINGDGFDDFAIPGRSNTGWKVGLYYGGPLLDTICDLRLGLDDLYPIGYTVRVHDINANGTDELISWSYTQKAVLLFELGVDADSIPDMVIPPANFPNGSFSFGESIVTGDFNGDNKPDLAVNLRPNHLDSLNGSVYMYWGGAGFDTIPDLIIRRPGPYSDNREYFGTLMVSLGDFNADGYDDLYAGPIASQDSVAYIFFGGPAIDTIPNITIEKKLNDVRPAGDVNHDGYNDLILGRYTSFSGFGDVSILFGGPEADGIFDLTIWNTEIGGFLKYFGRGCTDIGDFNGDGIDDFAFSAIDAFNIGHVYVYTGWDAATDVPYDYLPNLPEDFTLGQNYPNPFNLSTTIEFGLPRRSSVVLTIYNILGERLTTLISGDLQAGTYRLSWDGSNESGKPVASGVYLYELRAGEVTLSEKMVVLK